MGGKINCSDELLKKFIRELKREGLVKDHRLNSFQKTEQVLYKYHDFAEAIEAKEDQIKELEAYGIKKKSKSITKFGAGSGEVKSEMERIEEKIQAIENTIDDTRRYVGIIDSALSKIESDRFFPVIRMKYFERMTHEDIGFEIEVDPSTVCRQKNRLIRKLSVYLFPDDSLREMML